MHTLRTLAIPYTTNARDLGGIPTCYGVATHPGRFIRASDAGLINGLAVSSYISYGVRLDIDLRSPSEVERFPDQLGQRLRVRYRNIPLHNADIHQALLAPDAGNSELAFLTKTYQSMLANTGAIHRIFCALATSRGTWATLFHCAAGMDRTGIVSMLILSVCGVAREDIIADYAFALNPAAPLEPVMQALSTTSHTTSIHTQLTMAFAQVYDQLIATFGSVESYLCGHCHISAHTLERVRNHLLS